jgi:hypothetical protein
MGVIQRAATCACSFVAMNWDQVAALVYLARGAGAGAPSEPPGIDRTPKQGT